MQAIIGVTGGKTHLAADWDTSPQAQLFPACRSGGSTSRNNTVYVGTAKEIDCTRCSMMADLRKSKASEN
jgi:hypothetical protein